MSEPGTVLPICERLRRKRVVSYAVLSGSLANPDGPEAADTISALYAKGEALAEAVAVYRSTHDLNGDGHTFTGRAWDLMKRAENELRAALLLADGGGG